MLTAAAYGVEEFLFVYGDKPASGGRTGELTVRTMIDEARQSRQEPGVQWYAGVPRRGDRRRASAAGLEAGRGLLLRQVNYSNDALLRWRESADVSGPVYAGVMVLASAGMARRLAATIPDIHIPEALVAAVSRDPQAGVTWPASRSCSCGQRRVRRRPPRAGQPIPGGRRPARRHALIWAPPEGEEAEWEKDFPDRKLIIEQAIQL